VAACALIFGSDWLAWPLATWVNRRRDRASSASVRWARWLAAALGLLDLGLLAWFLSLMVACGKTYAYPARAVNLVTRLNWLTAPLTLAVLVVSVRSWRRRKVQWAWNVHYTLVAGAGIAFLWVLWCWNLVG
jgi:hypothetical protein